MKQFKFYILIAIAVLFSSCSSLKEGFTNQKKNNSDEFLVEKKSPLIMPPNFNELPLPKSSTQKNKEDDKTIESLISKSENKTIENKENKNQSLEKSILEKIK